MGGELFAERALDLLEEPLSRRDQRPN
jgi:hypothetical protein